MKVRHTLVTVLPPAQDAVPLAADRRSMWAEVPASGQPGNEHHATLVGWVVLDAIAAAGPGGTVVIQATGAEKTRP